MHLKHYIQRADERINDRWIGIRTDEYQTFLYLARPEWRGYGPTLYSNWRAHLSCI